MGAALAAIATTVAAPRADPKLQAAAASDPVGMDTAATTAAVGANTNVAIATEKGSGRGSESGTVIGVIASIVVASLVEVTTRNSADIASPAIQAKMLAVAAVTTAPRGRAAAVAMIMAATVAMITAAAAADGSGTARDPAPSREALTTPARKHTPPLPRRIRASAIKKNLARKNPKLIVNIT